MALLWMDSCGDHYSSFTPKWTSTQSSPAIVTGRTGNGIQCTTQDGITKILDAPTGSATCIVGFAAQFTGGDNTVNFLWLSDSGSITHLTFRFNSSRQIAVYRAGSTLLGTGSFVYQLNTWYYLEFKVKIDDTTGTVEVRHDGVVDLSLTSQDTRNAGTANIQTLQLGSFAAATNGLTFDDLYFLDDTGSAPLNDFLGDVKVEARFANGNGNSSQLDGSDGNQTDNYLLVDEASPNGDTDYVESSDVGDKDTYLYQDLTVGAGNVYAVHILPYTRKSDAGERTLKTVARLSATEEDGPSKVLSNTYQYLPDIRVTKPGGGAWSITDVNNTEFGSKVNT